MTNRKLTLALTLSLPLLALPVLIAACGGSGGGGSGSSHDRFFVVTGSHQGFACEKCHDKAASSFSLAATRDAGPPGVECRQCHLQNDLASTHAGKTGYAWDCATCIVCHKDGSGGLPANHNADFFPVTNTPHAGTPCSACHGATRGVTDLKCLSCHAQGDMAGRHGAIPPSTRTQRAGTITNYQYTLAACMRCHADGRYTISQHSGILNREGHAPFCLVCHQTMRPAGGTKPWGADFNTSTCLSCHTNNNGGGGD